MTQLLALTALAFAAQQPPRIEQYVQRNLDDASMVARVVKGDQRELRKINDDFGQSYRFETTHIQYKEPFKLRLEAKVEDTSILYIVNGTKQMIRIPRARINTRMDLNGKPGRRQTCMDFGVLTPSLFDGTFLQAKYVRHDRATDDEVFDLTYVAAQDDSSRHRVWIDPRKKVIDKREWYNQSGRQLATFYYGTPKLFDSVWLPTDMTVKNVEGKVAGVTRYDAIKINTGLPDSLFKVD